MKNPYWRLALVPVQSNILGELSLPKLLRSVAVSPVEAKVGIDSSGRSSCASKIPMQHSLLISRVNYQAVWRETCTMMLLLS